MTSTSTHPRVRVRAAHEGDLERVVAEVVEVAAVARDQPRVLDALDRLADHPGGHESTPGPELRGPLDRGDDVDVAGAPAEVPADRLAGLVAGRGGVVVEVRRDRGDEPGVQKPHCSAWHSWNACCTGPIPPSGVRQPSTVVISAPSRLTANSRHERIGRPSTSTVHAPHTPCSQPTWVPVSRRSWRSASDSSRRAGSSSSCRTPLTTRDTWTGLVMPRPRRSGRRSSRPAGPGLVVGLPERALGEHVRQAPAVRRGGVDVVLGVDQLVEQLARPAGIDRTAGAAEGRAEVHHDGSGSDARSARPVRR